MVPLNSRSITKERTIEEHRKMWNWIADETLKQDRIITKRDYFWSVIKNNPDIYNENFINDLIEYSHCFCCMYYHNILLKKKEGSCNQRCLLVWPGGICWSDLSPFDKWVDIITEIAKRGNSSREEREYASKLAREIANLPERECME